MASVKPELNWPPVAGAAGERGSGGGCPTSMKVEPGRVDFRCANLAMLIGYAFRFSPDRVTGPDWMRAVGSPRFHIVATLPRGASKDQVPEMFQALLAERFRLAIHRGTANLPVYALTVVRGGLQMKAADGGASTAEMSTEPSTEGFYGAVQSRVATDAAGQAVRTISSPRMGTVRETGDPIRGQRWEGGSISMAGLAELLDHVAPMSLPVIDATGVSGRYELLLEVSLRDARGAEPSDMDAGVADAFNRGLAKLGLRLEHRRAPVETIVVDRVERIPTEN